MYGTFFFTVIGIVITVILSYFGMHLKTAVFAPLFAMMAMMICMRIAQTRLRLFEEQGWEDVVEIDPALDNSYIKEFYMVNYGIFVPMTFSFYRFSPMRRGESAAEAVWIQICGAFVIFYSVWKGVYIGAAIAALIILLNLFVFRFPAIFYSDSHKDNAVRCCNNYQKYLAKQEKEMKHFVGSSLNMADRYTVGVAEINYRKIAEALDRKFS